MRTVLLASGSALLLLASALACSSFSSDGAEGADAAPDAAPADGDAGPPNGPDAGLADLGCLYADVKADLAKPIGSPFTTIADTDASFESASDDGGPYGRFTIEPLPDGGVPSGKRYYLAVPNSATHLCISARVRVEHGAPAGMYVTELAAVVLDRSMGYGAAGTELFEATRQAYSFWTTDPADGGVPSRPHSPTLDDSSLWHVVRVELDRADGGAWQTTTIAIDRRAVVSDVPIFVPGETYSTGEVAFGPMPLSPMSPTAAPIVMLYADLRFSQR